MLYLASCCIRRHTIPGVNRTWRHTIPGVIPYLASCHTWRHFVQYLQTSSKSLMNQSQRNALLTAYNFCNQIIFSHCVMSICSCCLSVFLCLYSRVLLCDTYLNAVLVIDVVFVHLTANEQTYCRYYNTTWKINCFTFMTAKVIDGDIPIP